MNASYQIKLDLISSLAALLCALHCVALPLFFSTLPLFGIEIIENLWIELATIFISLMVGGIAIYKGYTHHHKTIWIVWLFLLGIALMVTGNFMHLEETEYILKISGAVILLICHVANWKKSHRKNCSLINHNHDTQ
jgi:drug/metabolite transporter (DMT)-like permease